MGTRLIVVNENWSMPECIKEMRMQAEEMDEIYYVYVVDNDYRLRGVLPLKTLITHPSVVENKACDGGGTPSSKPTLRLTKWPRLREIRPRGHARG